MPDKSSGILILDDDQMLREALSMWLSLSGFAVIATSNVDDALAAVQHSDIAAVLSDIRMPGRDGMDFLRNMRKLHPDIPVVLITGHGDVPLAVAALKAGAFDFITKPHDPDRLVATLRNACAQRQLRQQLNVLAQEGEPDAVASILIGRSAVMRKVQDLVRTVADMPLDVLVRGETGTGKEIVARALHANSTRHDKPFVAINCAAIPMEIFESELFGHEAGAFTGARQMRLGKLEHAHGGTVFLDEVESMPEAAQAKLLRVIQERTVERIGSNKSIGIDIRIVSAAKVDLRAVAGKGLFRDDLYYRLAGFEIVLPSLRERGEDILQLFHLFALRAAARVKTELPPVSPHIARWLLDHTWPGNVRELKSVAERFGMGFGLGLDAETGADAVLDGGSTLDAKVSAYERTLILDVLEDVNWSMPDAEVRLGLPRRTLNDKIRRLGIVRPAKSG